MAAPADTSENPPAEPAPAAPIVKPPQTEDIWTQLQKRQKEEGDDSSRELGTTLVFVGAKGSGKTSLLLRFLDKRDKPRPTLALEYSFKYRSGNEIVKDLVHLWELGGGAFLSDLTAVPLVAENISTTTAFIVLDLSKPGDCVDELLMWIKAIRAKVEACMQQLQSKPETAPVARGMLEKAWKAYGMNHPDKALVNPCPIPLVVVGSKYDTFKNNEVERMKVLGRALRYICHINGASLIYTAEKDAATTKQLTVWLNHYAFGTSSGHAIELAANKALVVPVGADAVAELGSPPDFGGVKGKDLDMWIGAAHNVFPPSEKKDDTGILGEVDMSQFMEPAIDALRNEKNAELEQYRKDAAKRDAASAAAR